LSATAEVGTIWQAISMLLRILFTITVFMTDLPRSQEQPEILTVRSEKIKGNDDIVLKKLSLRKQCRIKWKKLQF